MNIQLLSNMARRFRRLLQLLTGTALLSVLAACGSGGGAPVTAMTPQSCGAGCGTAMITLTDAPGDITSYAVDLTSLSLTKADGTVVETLPVTTHVDLAKLVNLTELVSAGAIPTGEYVAASVTVDYTHAAVFVDTGGAAPVQATLVDGKGNPLTTLTLTVKLDDLHHFFISHGAISRLALDFNLAASNTVDLTKTPPVVTVQPFIVATVEPSDTKSTRVRGTLVSVDATAMSYVVNVQPFEDHDDKDSMGQATVNTTAQTTFEINGMPSTGAAGLTALAALAPGAWTVAYGTVSTTDHSFTASQVLAGTSVMMPSMDALVGVVIARSGNTLTVHGGTMQWHDRLDDEFMPKDVALTIGTGTTFTVAGQPTAMPTSSWPSVGSFLNAFGKAGVDSMGNPTFDATAGRVRLNLTTLWGFPAATGSNQVTLNLQSIEGLAPSAFTFTGTGTTSAQNSDPTKYVVSIGTLPPPAISTTSPVRYIGLVQPYGTAPPDFNAMTQIDYGATVAFLEVSFGDGSAAAFSTVSATQLVINIKDPLLGMMHSVRLGPQVIDLTTLTTSPTLVPDATGPDTFAIQTLSGDWSQSLSSYQSYASFEMALSSMLSGTTKVVRVLAAGQYDSGSNTLTAKQIAVVVHN